MISEVKGVLHGDWDSALWPNLQGCLGTEQGGGTGEKGQDQVLGGGGIVRQVKRPLSPGPLLSCVPPTLSNPLPTVSP